MTAHIPDPGGWLSQWVTDSLAYLTATCTPPWNEAATGKTSSEEKRQS